MKIIRTGAALLLLLSLVLSTCSAASNNATTTKQAKDKLRILAIFAHLGKSHFDVFKPLIEELARQGHDVTVISHFPRTPKAIAAEPLPNYKDVDLRDEKVGVFVNVVDLNLLGDSYIRVFKELYLLYKMGDIACDMGLRNPIVKNMVDTKQKYDVLLVENFNSNCFMALVHKFNAPFIQISTHQLMAWAIDDLGLTHEASYVPAMFTRLPKPMNFIERLFNVFTLHTASFIFRTIFNWRDYSLASSIYGSDLPDLNTVSNNASLMMVNTHYTLHGARNFPPNVIEVGGIHVSPKVNPLPKNLAQFLDNAHEGVVYFNLGSMVKLASMPEDKLKVLMKVFGSIPRKVLWKWEVDDVPDLPSNVLVQKWLPQYDILNHPNVKCYFGHGGLLGLTEGAQTGVPMILMPLYGDQYQNSIAAQARGVAIVVSYTNLDEPTLTHALNEIFNNTSYQKNSKKLAKAFKDRPAPPLETAVWWTEYIGRGNNLQYIRSDATSMPAFQRNLLDVAAFLLVVTLLVLYGSYKIFKRLTKKPKKVTTSKKRD